MIDTHTHIYLPEEYEGNNVGALYRARQAGVSSFIFPNIDASSIEGMLALHRVYPECTYIAAGLHPTEVRENWPKVVAECLECAADPACVAIGEVGMDLYWDKTYRDLQKEALEAQMSEAVERKLPVIIHCREALDDVLDVIRSLHGNVPPMVFHSFTGGIDDVRKIRSVAEPYFGINGVVTFHNAKQLRETLPEIGIDRILLETDSPYLSPAPFRGKRNESSRLPYILYTIAKTLKLSTAAAEKATDHNATTLFRLKPGRPNE